MFISIITEVNKIVYQRRADFLSNKYTIKLNGCENLENKEGDGPDITLSYQ